MGDLCGLANDIADIRSLKKTQIPFLYPILDISNKFSGTKNYFEISVV